MNHYNLAVVEDEEEMFEKLSKVLKTYFSNKNESFLIEHFSSAEGFLHKANPTLDIIFMDIGLPGMNGMDAIKKLRETNPNVIVIFVTYLSQFAIEGYSVGAFDYILKPFDDNNVFMALDRALIRLNKHTECIFIGNRNRSITHKIPVESIKFIESGNHRVFFHLTNGVIPVNGSIKKFAEELEKYSFVFCSASYLVNLKYLASIDGNEVKVGDEIVYISRSKKKDFLQSVNEYVGKGG